MTKEKATLPGEAKTEAKTEAKSEAKTEAKETKPDYSDEFLHTAFNIVIPETKEDVEIYFLGCGEGENAEPGMLDAVAALMNQTAAKNKKSPHLIIFLGDMLTAKGILPNGANYHLFNSHFHSIYQSPKYPWINKVPCIILPGNHDINAEKGSVDYQRLKMQILHSYMDLSTNKPDPVKLDLLKKDNIPIEALQAHHNKWNELKRFGTIHIGKHVKALCVDTDTIVNDHRDRAPQALWLREEHRKNPTATKLACTHHGFLSNTKRGHPDYTDAPDYLGPAIVEKLKEEKIIPADVTSHNQMVRQVMSPYPFHTCISAHDHCNGCQEEKDICQITAGGAGGSIQSRLTYANPLQTICYLAEHGFVLTRIPPGPNPVITSDFLTLPGSHLHYVHRSGRLTKQPRSPQLQKLSEMVIASCREFQEFLSKIKLNPLFLKNKIIETEGLYPDCLKYSDKLKNYFERYEAPEMKAALLFLAEALTISSSTPATYYLSGKRLLEKGLMSDIPLFYKTWQTIFNRNLETTYRMTYEEFIANPEKILTIPVGPFVEMKESDLLLPPISVESKLPIATTPLAVPVVAPTPLRVSVSTDNIPSLRHVATSSSSASSTSSGSTSSGLSRLSVLAAIPSPRSITTILSPGSPTTSTVERKTIPASTPISIPVKKVAVRKSSSADFTPASYTAVLSSQPLSNYLLLSPTVDAVSPLSASTFSF